MNQIDRDLETFLTSLSPQEISEYAPKLDKLKYQAINEKIRFYEPNGAQQRWIDDICRENSFICINAAGNGSGKTYGLIAILAGFFWPDIAPQSLRQHTIQKFRGPKRARIISTPKELEDVGSIQTTIEELWPQGRYTPDKNGKSFYSRFKTDTGWVLDLMSYEQDVSEFAGPNLGLVVFNEPMPKKIWDESIVRTRAGGIILVAMTSLREHPWVVDGLLSRANGKDIRCVYGDIEDNCKEHGLNGTLEHAQIEKILSQYDPDEREARKTGKPLRFSGRIYKSFNRDVHVAKSPIKVPSVGVSHYMACDPAIGKPFACIWAYVDGTDTVHIYDEYPNYDFEGAKDSNLSVRDYAALFRRKERQHGVTAIDRIIDRHFANKRETTGGITLKQEFAEAGIEFVDSYTDAEKELNEVEAGILAVKEYLRYDVTRKVDNINRPKIVISPNCINTILSFERWTRDPDNQKPTQNYKDHADCVRYLLKASPEYNAPKNWNVEHKPFYGVGH